MSLSLYPYNSYKRFTSEISQNNILNYKRRSNLVSKTYCYETNERSINKVETLQNCYNTIYDMKIFLTDYVSYLKNNKNRLSSSQKEDIKNIIEKTKVQFLSAFNIYILSKKKEKNKQKNKDENTLLKNISNIIEVTHLLYKDLLEYQ